MTWFKTICVNINSTTDLIEGNVYYVRAADKHDCSQYEKYCVLKGTIWETNHCDLNRDSFVSEWDYQKYLSTKYNGTYVLDLLITKEDCRKFLKYIN